MKRYLIVCFILVCSAVINAESLTHLPFNGDLLFRYDRRAENGDPVLSRLQLRLRARTEFVINDKSLLLIGLATGEASEKSQKVSLDNNSIPFNLDLVTYRLFLPNNSTLDIGKINSPFWKTTHTFWYSEFTAGGVGFSHQRYFTESSTYWLKAGYLVLEDMSEGSDPALIGLQNGITYNLDDEQALTVSFGTYNFADVQGEQLSGNSGTNTVTQNNVLSYRYTPYMLSGEYVRPGLRLYADYVNNVQVTHSNQAGVIGSIVGLPLEEIGDWNVNVAYMYLQRDAWIDALVDLSFYRGQTDVKGLRLSYSTLYDRNVKFVFNTYFSERISDTSFKEVSYQFLTQIDF